ncbi:MAG: leucyl/phenylalanyl-tRNA--protein transferase [Cryomorphaceae bacterium]|nr:leucyl/phenylalanyl-tRNA--protein transferase [Cryomorphaceae bacterium]
MEVAIGKHFFPFPIDQDGDRPIAVGGDLKPETLLAAYSHGYFPWHDHPFGICWYHPDPRMVLFPEKLKVQKSMRPFLNGKYQLKVNEDFEAVLDGCAQVERKDQNGTWIWPKYHRAMLQMHEAGHAHSYETFCGGERIGGFYGLYLNGIFYGESMYSVQPNASKFAFIKMVQTIPGLRLVDCQTPTSHLASLGAEEVSRKSFLALLGVARV